MMYLWSAWYGASGSLLKAQEEHLKLGCVERSRSSLAILVLQSCIQDDSTALGLGRPENIQVKVLKGVNTPNI